MGFFKHLFTVFLLLAFTTQVSAGPGGDLNLVNYTPYVWRLKWQHSYQIQWNPPPWIPPNAYSTQYIKFAKWSDNGDCAAEAIYELEGSPGPAQFTVKARLINGKRILIKYNDHLSSVGSPEDSEYDLGFEHDGGVLFALSGDGRTPYFGGQPPVGWMQATMPVIGEKPLRNICLPTAHDAGMSELKSPPWFGGVWHNTCTQDATVFRQLEFGARWFDIRPFLRNGVWFTGHFSQLGIRDSWVGGTGRSIADIINDINAFTTQHPGELIVLDLTHELKFNGGSFTKWDNHFSDDDWRQLLGFLSLGIHDLWGISPSGRRGLPEDLTTVPLSTFVRPGSRSAVLIRYPWYLPTPATDFLPSAFVNERSLPHTGSYSETSDPVYLNRDQGEKLRENRVWPDRVMHRGTYTFTQSGTWVSDVANWYTSIVGLARGAQRVLFADIWGFLSVRTYPNLVEVDYLHNHQVTSLCMVINDRWGNSVPY